MYYRGAGPRRLHHQILAAFGPRLVHSRLHPKHPRWRVQLLEFLGHGHPARSIGLTKTQLLVVGEDEQLAEMEQQMSEQAADQWLRKIPDDPGGLLRRKFIYQYQNRAGNSVEADPW